MKALGTISALISVTILWVTFTILEAADGIRSIFGRKPKSSGDDDDDEEDGERYIFCMTWIELGFGLCLLAFWTCTSFLHFERSWLTDRLSLSS
jgi:hypothetical protein